MGLIGATQGWERELRSETRDEGWPGGSESVVSILDGRVLESRRNAPVRFLINQNQIDTLRPTCCCLHLQP